MSGMPSMKISRLVMQPHSTDSQLVLSVAMLNLMHSASTMAYHSLLKMVITIAVDIALVVTVPYCTKVHGGTGVVITPNLMDRIKDLPILCLILPIH